MSFFSQMGLGSAKDVLKDMTHHTCSLKYLIGKCLAILTI
jgi:hypothetical protein